MLSEIIVYKEKEYTCLTGNRDIMVETPEESKRFTGPYSLRIIHRCDYGDTQYMVFQDTKPSKNGRPGAVGILRVGTDGRGRMVWYPRFEDIFATLAFLGASSDVLQSLSSLAANVVSNAVEKETLIHDIVKKYKFEEAIARNFYFEEHEYFPTETLFHAMYAIFEREEVVFPSNQGKPGCKRTVSSFRDLVILKIPILTWFRIHGYSNEDKWKNNKGTMKWRRESIYCPF